MTDRGNCKFFVPNYFNPTKCQNCFKQKDQHTNQEATSGTNKPALSRKGSVKVSIVSQYISVRTQIAILNTNSQLQDVCLKKMHIKIG